MQSNSPPKILIVFRLEIISSRSGRRCAHRATQPQVCTLGFLRASDNSTPQRRAYLYQRNLRNVRTSSKTASSIHAPLATQLRVFSHHLQQYLRSMHISCNTARGGTVCPHLLQQDFRNVFATRSSLP
jgi:hypothetical protein